MDKCTYHWIQDYRPHKFTRRYKARHYRYRRFRYFMLAIHVAQAVQGLCGNSPHGQTTRHVLSHKERGKYIVYYFINHFSHWMTKEKPWP